MYKELDLELQTKEEKPKDKKFPKVGFIIGYIYQTFSNCWAREQEEYRNHRQSLVNRSCQMIMFFAINCNSEFI